MLPPESAHVDSEAELAVEIGRVGRRIHEDDALDFVAGYRCANDVSARDLQRTDKQWTRAKGFDTFCPLGAELVPVSELGDASGLRVVQRLNGELFQDGNTADLVFGIRRLVAFVSSVFTLEPGDLILTGTPSGVGIFRTPPIAMAPGDLVEIEIDGIGVLRNPVVAERGSRRAPPLACAPRLGAPRSLRRCDVGSPRSSPSARVPRDQPWSASSSPVSSPPPRSPSIRLSERAISEIVKSIPTISPLSISSSPTESESACEPETAQGVPDGQISRRARRASSSPARRAPEPKARDARSSCPRASCAKGRAGSGRTP